ncbi:MAG: type II/IV secretion system ATPase subunit, partial [Candidatus Aenigmarchaeota archaeon]|nr:type II/IV secretion system ATPase subunit [Candidatus Aenigmarchaeota archaeon]
SRVQSTLGTDIARKGSNFTIRKFTKDPLTPVHLQKFKTLNSDVAAYLWLAIDYGRSMLISGGTATGKTSMLNAMSLFIKPELKIVSIEDTPELRLPHTHWVPSVARQPIAEIEGTVLGEVDMFALLRESLRQRPDYLIVGEVRGREAYVLFQQIATGHASLSTIHADSLNRLIDRLTTPPINLPANLIESLDIIIFLTKIKYGNSYVRKVASILEILGFDREKNVPIVNEVFKWNPRTDKFEQVNPSVIVKKISEQYGINKSELEKEIKNRKSVLDWMSERGILDFMDVARIIKIYYSRPEELLDAI